MTMPPHSALFTNVLDREDHSRTASPALSRPSTMMRSPNPYWGEDIGRARDYSYPQYGRDSMSSPLSGTVPLANPARSSSAQHGAARTTGPTIDFSGLIPMYDTARGPGTPDITLNSARGGQLIDLAYEPEQWPAASMSQYATFQRTRQQTLWQADAGPHDQWSHGSSSNAHASFGAYPSAAEYSPPSPYSSATSSGSTSPSYFAAQLGSAAAPALPSSARSAPATKKEKEKECFHCHVTSTPLWRREPTTHRPLCNACGLYMQQRHKPRPQALIDADRCSDDDDEINRIPDAEYTGPRCSHCATRQTSVWRRSKTGAQVCNACGVYARLRGKERPLSLRRNKIKPRTKHTR